MKEELDPRDIAAEGPAFATHVPNVRQYKIETEAEARLLHRYAMEITRYIRQGKEGTYLHGVEEMPDLTDRMVAELRFERNSIFSSINSFAVRTGIKVTMPLRNIRKPDPRYFDMEEYKRETKP